MKRRRKNYRARWKAPPPRIVTAAVGLARGLWRELQTQLFPQHVACHLCGAPLAAGEETLCGGCQDRLNALALPEDRIARFKTQLAFELAAYRYRAEARELVHRLKYSGELICALPLGEGMTRAWALVPQQADVIVPVPLHASRQEERGYNQAAVLAEALSRHVSLPVDETLLARPVATPAQVGKSRAARLKNVRGAFSAQHVEGLRVLLVDDVRTTGATAQACAEALLEAGAQSVGLLTACRA